MASFVGLAEGMGFAVDAGRQLEWGELGDERHPVPRLSAPARRSGRLGAFVQAGGNVVIADDFGEGKDAMAALGLLRAEVAHAARDAGTTTDQPWAPIATARGDHPLAREVDETSSRTIRPR